MCWKVLFLCMHVLAPCSWGEEVPYVGRTVEGDLILESKPNKSVLVNGLNVSQLVQQINEVKETIEELQELSSQQNEIIVNLNETLQKSISDNKPRTFRVLTKSIKSGSTVNIQSGQSGSVFHCAIMSDASSQLCQYQSKWVYKNINTGGTHVSCQVICLVWNDD